MLEPPVAEIFDDRNQFFAAGGLHHIGVGAQPVGPLDIFIQTGRGQHHQDHGRKRRLFANPLQHREPIDLRQFEVQEDYRWQWISFAVGELARSAQVIQGPPAIIDDLDRVEDSRFSEGVFQEKDIVLLIFDNQQRFVHKRGVSNFLTLRHTTGPWKVGWR